MLKEETEKKPKAHFIRCKPPSKKKPSLRFTFDVETWGLDARKKAFSVMQNIETSEQWVFSSYSQVKQFLQEKRKEYLEISGIEEKDLRVLVYAMNGWKYDFIGLHSIDDIKQAQRKIDINIITHF